MHTEISRARESRASISRTSVWITLGVLCMLATLAAPALAQVTTFNVTTSGMTAYVINGVANPMLNLRPGQTYTFNVNTPGHPFFIKTTPVTGTGSTFDQGVVNNGITSGTLSFQVPQNAPPFLFYQCSIHSVMTGQLMISPTAVPLGPPGTLLVLGIALLLLTVSLRRFARERSTAAT